MPKNIEIKSLKQSVDEGELVLDPDYQRNFVWDDKRCSRLIESILINIPIPAIFLARKKDGNAEIIDGQQRITAIFRYLDNKYKISNVCRKELAGKYFQDLNDKQRKSIRNYSIFAIELNAEENPDAIYEMFERINTGSVKLNSQEIRNAIYRGDFNNFIKELSKHKKFRKTIGGNEKNLENRMVYEELVLLFFTARDLFRENKWSIALTDLNNYMKGHKIFDEAKAKKYSKIFENAFTIINDLFGNEAFSPYIRDDKTKTIMKSSSSGGYNKGLFLSMTYLFANNKYDKNQYQGKKDAIIESIKRLMINDEDFIKSTIHGATLNVKNIKTRTEILEKCIDEVMNLDEPSARFFSYELKEELFNKSSVCKLCKNKIDNIEQSEADHIKPYAKGGKTTADNAQLLHYYCNRKKTSK